MRQDRYLNVLLTSSALLDYEQLSRLRRLDTDIQPYDRGYAFRRGVWDLNVV